MGFSSVIVAVIVLLSVIFWTQIAGQNSDLIPDGFEEVTVKSTGGFGAFAKCGEGDQEGRNICVPYYRCDGKTKTVRPEESLSSTNRFGELDLRFGENNCEKTLDVCCQIRNATTRNPTPSTPDSSTSPPTPAPVPAQSSSFCGIRNENGIDFKLTGNTKNEAEYGEFPWMVAVLNKNLKSNKSVAICGGSLITPKIVLTAAHCFSKHVAGDLKVRAGEWDTQTQDERLPYQERNVASIIVHEDYKPDTLFNDVALVVLKSPYKKAEHINTICLPEQDQVVNSENCFASGWGKNLFERDGEYQVILKKIELPVVSHDECQTKLRKTRLGSHFILDKSFSCAGGKGRDTCTGDGGGPLVCPDPNNSRRYVQAGIVAWGIGCGVQDVPGVYADVAKFRNWIDDNVQKLGASAASYTI